MCEPLYYSADALLGAVPFMAMSPADRTRHWAGRALVFAWAFAVPCAAHGLVKGLAFALGPYCLLGFLFFGFSQVHRACWATFDSHGLPVAAHPAPFLCVTSTGLAKR